MKNSTFHRGFLPAILIGLLFSGTTFAQPAVTINPPSAANTNIIAGGTVSFTATRNSNSGNWTGGNSQFTYTFTASGPGSVSFTNNPNTVSGNNSTAVGTFTTPGVYTVTCTVSEGGGGLTATSPAKTVSVVVAPSAPNLWATSSDGNQVSSFTVANGLYVNGPTNIFDPFPSTTETTAALGRNASPSAANGHFYWLPNSNNNSGVVNVYAATATGGSITNIGSLDLNGAGTNSLGFVRLGMGPDGRGWILAGDGSTVYLAKFTSNGVNPVAVTLEDANGVTLVGGAASTFQNGDLCVSGNGNIYALANDGNGVTQIFIGSPGGNSTTLTKRWDLVNPNGSAFTGRVNGVAFDALGSLYLSTDDGLYFIDQNTVNGPAGTVQCALVVSQSGLQDLASNVFPTQSTLPVKLHSFSGTLSNGMATLSWSSENEQNFSHFEAERSLDGVHFSSIGTVTAYGNTGVKNNYQLSDAVAALNAKVLYYRLKNVDRDGKFAYSTIVALRTGGKLNNYTVYPNPFASEIKIQVNSVTPEQVIIRLRNTSGQTLLEKAVALQAGENLVVLNEAASFKAGIYLLEIAANGHTELRKIIKK